MSGRVVLPILLIGGLIAGFFMVEPPHDPEEAAQRIGDRVTRQLKAEVQSETERQEQILLWIHDSIVGSLRSFQDSTALAQPAPPADVSRAVGQVLRNQSIIMRQHNQVVPMLDLIRIRQLRLICWLIPEDVACPNRNRRPGGLLETPEQKQERLVAIIRDHDPALYDRIMAMKAEGIPFKIEESFRLEKFDGEWEPGKEPFEVIEGADDGTVTVTRKEDHP